MRKIDLGLLGDAVLFGLVFTMLGAFLTTMAFIFSTALNS